MSNKKNIIISGGSGKLGSYLKKLDNSIIAPTRAQMDILDQAAIDRFFSRHNPEIFIHCAAMTGPIQCDNDPVAAMHSNIAGTCNIVAACYKYKTRLIYISTDYVFRGDKGNYAEEDELYPQNLYAWSKLGGECAARMYADSLVIRTSFSPDIFPYDKAFVDQYTSRDSLKIIAPLILKLAKIKNVIGVIHVGTKRKTVKELALKLGKKDIKDLRRCEVPFAAPYDTSFNLKKLNKILKK